MSLPPLGGEPKGNPIGETELRKALSRLRSANVKLPADHGPFEGLRVQSFGIDYVVVKYPPAKPGAFSKSQGRVFYLLDSQLNFLDCFRPLTPRSEDEIALNHTHLGTFGATGAWFVWEERYKESIAPFNRECRIYLVKPGFPLALKVKHYLGDTAYSWYEEDVVDDEPFIGFFAPQYAMNWLEKGVGRDGKEYSPRIVWDNASRVFRGPAELTWNGTMLYQVDMKKSAYFHAIDQ